MSKKGKEYLKGWMPFRIMRYYGFALITLFSLVIPWIKINEHHFFLLSFQNFKLDLMFVQFDMQEMYLMPFLLILLFVGIFGITVLGGRVFCGWMCPQTIFRVIYRDFIETKLLGLRKRIQNKQKDPDYSKIENQVKRVIAVLLWTALAAIAAADMLWFFVPPEDFLTQILNPNEHPIVMGTFLTIVAFLVADIVFIKENFCIYVCPYSRVQSVLYDDDTVMAIYNPHRGGEIYDEDKNKLYTKEKEIRAVEPASECTACESCVTVCPTHIDIRQGLQLECINCLECVDACTTVMGNLGKESLVTWSSDKEIIHQKGKTNFFRSKVVGTGIMMVLTMVLLGFMGSKKEHMLLNINKENRLYSIKHLSDGKNRVDNAFTFLLQNTLNEEHKYFFEIIQPEGINGKITIAKPTAPFKAQPNVKKKKIVIFRTTDMLVDNPRKDTIIPITIKAYAIDDPENIVVFRKTTFTFPRSDKLK
jgi:cytochrome c oxidase accessory protein FixG